MLEIVYACRSDDMPQTFSFDVPTPVTDILKMLYNENKAKYSFFMEYIHIIEKSYIRNGKDIDNVVIDSLSLIKGDPKLICPYMLKFYFVLNWNTCDDMDILYEIMNHYKCVRGDDKTKYLSKTKKNMRNQDMYRAGCNQRSKYSQCCGNVAAVFRRKRQQTDIKQELRSTKKEKGIS